MSVLWLGSAAGLLLLSSLLATAEKAVFSLGDSRLRTLTSEGFDGADALGALRANDAPLQPALRLLVTVLNLASVGLGTVSTWTARSGVSAAVGTLAVVAAVLLVGEILPRAASSRWRIRIALLTAPPLFATERWLRLALSPVHRLERLLSGGDREDLTTSEEREVREITELGREEGKVDAEEHLLVERAFRLDELTAWDVMVPRVDIFAWRDSLTLGEIIGELATVPYSRVPVYAESIDDVTGILYVREAYAAHVSGQVQVTLKRLSVEPFFVPGSLSLKQLLRDFQARRNHMGIVADEFGGTDGLVTLEDVLEELVGEIVDETDITEEPLMRISRNQLAAAGSVDLREINYAFNVSLPQLEHRSLNGFLLEEFGYVPARGESVEVDGIRIDILEANETQVLRARLIKLVTGGALEEETRA